MRVNSSSSKLIPRKISFLLFILLIVSSMFYMVACSTTNDQIENNTEPIQEENLEIDMNTDPFSETEKTLSLEGYGAKGALTDQEMSIADMLMYAVQDEYLAHGEYSAIIAKFGNQNPYTNIILAEETHLSYLKDIYIAEIILSRLA